MLYSALLRVSSTMGDCPSGNPPLCLHIMFVLYFFCYWRNKYSSSSEWSCELSWCMSADSECF